MQLNSCTDFGHHTVESIDYESGALLAGGLIFLETSDTPSTAPLEQGNNTWEQGG